jgi:ABC-type transport system involved in cytochrome c biogenesis permease subunit
MPAIEVAAHWSAASLYIADALLAGAAACFGRARWLTLGIGVLALGAVAHAAALVARWVEQGHAPYLGRYEAFSSHALVIAAVFLLLQARIPSLRPGSVIVAPAVFLLLGIALLSPAAPTYPSPAMNSPWLVLHVSVAKLALATAVASGTASLIGLRVSSGTASLIGLRLSSGRAIEQLSQRMLGYVFFLMSVVILSGAVWANAAWGAYWSWDPVETWSLAFWAGCALVLHLRTAGGWTGQRWNAAVVALTVVGIVTFFGYGHFGLSAHAAYIAP